MGIPILPELIDFEIRDIVNEHINEAFDFLQTSGCCSGWSGDPEVVNGAGQPSDGVNGVWVGRPYMNLESLDDSKALGEFLPFVMSRMIRDDQQTLMTPQFAKYLEGLSAAGLVDDGISKLTSVMVGFRNGRVTMSLYFADDTPELSAKVWELFRNVLIEFKQLMASA